MKLLCVIAVVVFSTAALAADYSEVQVTNGGTIRGKVQYSGDLSTVRQMAVNQDMGTCGKMKQLPSLVVGRDRGVQYAMVRLVGIRQGKKLPAAGKATLAQVRCEYQPHALAVPVGTQLEIVNSDNVFHNVHAYDLSGQRQTAFNIAQPVRGLRTTVPLQKPGVLLATCDAGHPWMSAHIFVEPTPYYALTDAAGNYVIDNVPPGRYKIQMWHEPAGMTESDPDRVQASFFDKAYIVTKPVTVPANGAAEVNFEFQ